MPKQISSRRLSVSDWINRITRRFARCAWGMGAGWWREDGGRPFLAIDETRARGRATSMYQAIEAGRCGGDRNPRPK